MRRLALPTLLLFLPALVFCADFAGTIAKADLLHDQGQHLEARTILLGAVTGVSNKELAELYWRISRETLDLGDQAEKQKQPQASILKLFDEGEAYANKAIEADSQSYLAYYWKSANVGRWGQVKGILDSLFRAGPMKDLLVKDIGINAQHSDAYYVLGQLYRELPGWPLSFGNIDFAVSLGRKALDVRQSQIESGAEKDFVYAFYTELAKTLYKRNRSAQARVNEQKAEKTRFAAAKDVLEKGCAYEGTVTLQNLSDREEAKALINYAIAALEKKQNRTSADDGDLEDARVVLKGW